MTDELFCPAPASSGGGSIVICLTTLPVRAEPVQTTLRFIPQADLRSIDPIWTTAYVTRNFGYLVFDTLFALDKDFKPQPQMVDHWQVSDDKLTYTFVLRDGLKWHDGQPVRAVDCIASIERWGKRDPFGQADGSGRRDQTARYIRS